MGKSGEGGGITAGQEITTLSEISFGFLPLLSRKKRKWKKKWPSRRNLVLIVVNAEGHKEDYLIIEQF